MRINNNLMAMNTHRMLGINTTAGATSVEKLSSGYRINRAGDDAAGLAISEKMRSQIRGLGQASRNALDDISLIQTTEGALNETHAIIHRMREMAVQSANDTNTDDDRSALQAEMDQLAQEVTRIANNTEFNTRKLLNGNLDGSGTVLNATGNLVFHIGANTNQNMQFSVKAMDAFSLGLTEDIAAAAAVAGNGTMTGTSGESYTVTTPNGENITINFQAASSGSGNTATAVKNGNVVTITYESGADANAIQTALRSQVTDATFAASGGGSGFDLSDLAGKSISVTGGSPEVLQSDSAAATFQAGGAVDKEAVVAKGIDIQTQGAANVAIARIDQALKSVSDVRAGLGAIQNRLGHTIKNLDVAAENLQASESRIRDVDMAKEMMTYTKNNILQQAAQAMLAQANQAPQSVLQLLR